MPYVYRYIDLKKEEVIYIGKVSGYSDWGFDPLERRHKQHRHESWYKELGEENILFQYIDVDTPADADILESYLISQYYGRNQLKNVSKTEWGRSDLKIDFLFCWKNFKSNSSFGERIRYLVDWVDEGKCDQKQAISSMRYHIREHYANNERKQYNTKHYLTDMFFRNGSENNDD